MSFVWNIGVSNDTDAGTESQCENEICQCLSDHMNVSVSDCVHSCLFLFVCVLKLAVVYIFWMHFPLLIHYSDCFSVLWMPGILQ